MGVKDIYTDTREKTIHQVLINKDVEKAKAILRDRSEYRQFSKNWQAVNLDEYVAKFNITSDNYDMVNNLRKISFFDHGRNYEIVASIGGRYFRIIELHPDGIGNRYVNLDLNEPSISGNFQGKARRAEQQRLTHFRMTYKKGTV